jgi:class 3 adenylate cyclase/tetratricopeptide (TPR) repeat protein
MADPAARGGAIPRQAERKLVTVLLAEVDEAVTTWTDPDPEDVERSVAADVTRIQAEVERFGGVIEQRVGGRALAVFGLPRTHDDDPERAVRAALAIRQALTARAGVRTRVAVATGRALVRLGARGAAGQRVLGDPIATCARLLEVAPPGAILVAEATVRASERTVAYGPAGMVALRSGEPAVVWSPLDPDGAPGPGLQGRRSPPLVARDAELAALLDQVSMVVATGTPRLVTVLGEPGIGKSRLLAELSATVETGDRPLAWRQGRSPPYGAMAFLALAQVVKAEAAILESDTAEQAERKLRRTVQSVLGRPEGPGESQGSSPVSHRPEATAWVTGQLLRLVGGRAAAGTSHPLDDGDSSEEMLGVWRRFLYALAAKRPLVLAVEDAQWADPALLDFLESLADPRSAPPAGSAPLLVIVTARPELAQRRPRWGGRHRTAGTTIRLEPLSDADTAALLAVLLDNHGLAPEVAPELLARAGGNPLFAEEYVRMVRDRGVNLEAPGGTTLPVPETVHGIVAARLDALPAAEKAVLQDAAVLGPLGWVGALAELGRVTPAELDAPLRRLEARELLQLDGRAASGDAGYAFRHVVVRDVAYNQILRAERVAKHLGAAAWLERLGADRPAEQTDLLAYHYRAALELSRAVGEQVPGLEELTRTALRDAGDRAAALGLYQGAARSYAEALQLCPPADPQRAELLLRLGRARCRGEGAGERALLAARDAFEARGDQESAAEAELLLGELAFLGGRGGERAAHLDRARALVAGAAPSPVKAAVARGRMAHLAMANRHAEAREAAAEVLAMARELGLPELEADALGTIGLARVDAGDAGGLADLEAAIATFEREGTPGISWYLNLAYALAALGNLARCFRTWEAAARLAERFGSMRALRSIQLQRVAEHYWTGQWDQAVSVVDALVASPGGEGHYLEWECRVWRGRIRLARGNLDGALADSAAALELARRTADPMALNPACAFRACALLAAGREGAARAMTGELLAGLGGSLPGAELSSDLGTALASLGHPLALLDRCGLPPSPWLGAARALIAGEPSRAADLYARIGARPEEAGARLAAARLALAAGRAAEAEADLDAAAAFYREVGAYARLAEAEALGLA